jgi:hypothetical protein
MTTPQMPFSQPDKREGFAPRDNPQWMNQLMVIRPESVEKVHFPPNPGEEDKGPTDVVTAYVAIVTLTDPKTNLPVVIEGASIAGKGMTPQLKNRIGDLVLGRLSQKPSSGQKSGAYYIADYTPQDAELAMRYIAAFPIPPMPTPFTQPLAPAPQQWGQPPVAGAAAPNYNPNQYQAPSAQIPPAPALPYDQWQHTAAAPPQQAPVAPVPAAQQWGGPTPQAAPPQAVTQPSGQDPNLVAFLQSKGIQVTPDMDNNTLQMIYNQLPQ